MRARLEILSGPASGRVIPLPVGARLVLGREDADFDLRDPFVSNRHASISCDGDCVMVEDLGSRNGSFLGELPMTDAVEMDGSKLLRLGTSTLRLVRGGDHAVEWVGETPGRGSTMDLASLGPKSSPRSAWLAALSKVLLSPAQGDELLEALCLAAVESGPFTRICFGRATDPLTDSAKIVAARAAGEYPLFGEPVKLATDDERPALVTDMALDPASAGTPPGQLFCSAAFVRLRPPPGLESSGVRSGWIYGDTLGEGKTLGEADLSSLADLGRIVIAMSRRSNSGTGDAEIDERRFLGSSQVVRKLLEQVQKVARSSISVVLHGETGTGKEILAQLLHEQSGRDGPIVAVNCAALPESLAESLLFGHEKGAFTGAETAALGMIRQAAGGTLFLDEVAELALPLQAKLLRVLEQKQVLPVGATIPVRVDLRVVAATHRDLDEEIAASRFREDLAWRLRGVTLEVPSLRDRPEDILLLATCFVEAAARREGASRRLGEAAEARLCDYSWPGNVRELQHVCQRAVLLSETPMIGTEVLMLRGADQREAPDTASPETGNVVVTLKELEKLHVRRALAVAKGNKSKAARLLGVDRSTLYDKIRLHGL